MLTFDPKISELKPLILVNQTQQLYSQLFTIDLTTLNKEFGYEIGSKFKELLINQITNSQNNNNNLLFIKILGGKILTISKKQINTELKIQLQEFSEETFQSKKRYLYINEKEISKINKSPEELLIENLQKEIHLTKHRENIQKQLSQIQTLQETENYNQLWKKTNQNATSIKIDLKPENIRNLLKYAKHSYYLTQSLYAYSKNETNVLIQNSIAYNIWYKIQELLLENFKTEKMKAIIEYRKTSQKFKIQNQFIQDWFNASIKSLYPHFNQTQLTKGKIIETQIIELNNKSDDEIKKLIPNLIKQLEELINEIDIKGFQSIPLINFTPNQASQTFISRQIYKQFKPENKQNWQQQIQNYYSQDFIKPEYKGFIKGDSKSILESSTYLNKNQIKENPTQYISFGFLEIDFFNSFNNYFFPTDSDKFYKNILDTIFETTNPFFQKYSEVFKTLNIGILGDEFFFLFLTPNKLTKLELKTIKIYLKLVARNLLEQTKTTLIIKTGKTPIIDNDNNELIIRVPLEKTNLINTPKLEIGKISISKYLLTNYKYNFLSQNTAEFNNIYDHLDLKMKEIKKTKQKELLIENF